MTVTWDIPNATEPSGPATAAAPAAPAELPPISSLDIRVGRIIKCEQHPDAESLYVEQVCPCAFTGTKIF